MSSIVWYLYFKSYNHISNSLLDKFIDTQQLHNILFQSLGIDFFFGFDFHVDLLVGFIEMHFNDVEAIVAGVFGVEVEFEGLTFLLFRWGHGWNWPHFEEFLDWLLCYVLFVLDCQLGSHTKNNKKRTFPQVSYI